MRSLKHTPLFLAALIVFILYTLHASVVLSAFQTTTILGGQGSGNGLFMFPEGVTARGSYIYVGDSQNDRIQKFDLNGNFITKWGTSGSGNGQFSNSKGVAVDSTGNVYVVDWGNHRVQKFDSSGTYITQWGTVGTADGEFIYPEGIAIDASDNIYIADRSDRIQKFNTSGTFITSWGGAGSGDGKMNDPEGIAVDSSGNVYLADTQNHRIQKFTSAGTFVTKWGDLGPATGQFNTPEAITVDSSGTVYVADSGNHRIQTFTSSGTFIETWGTQGSGTNQLDSPSGIYTFGGKLYVADESNSRIVIYSNPITPTPTASAASSSDHPGLTRFSCVNGKPVSSPELFQINTDKTSATLHFVPSSGAVDKYYIAYGYQPGEERFGVEFAQGRSDGAITYTVNALQPNVKYFFKIRAGNGCMPGDWGNALSATPSTNKEIFFLH